MNKPAHQNYAPFGSVSSKNGKKKKKEQLTEPGPGSYDVSLPLITPVVQTIRKKNNNVIVKLGHLGTPAFYGDERFMRIKSGSQLGPGQYQFEKKQKHSPKKERKDASHRLREILENPVETVPTITEVKQVSFDDEIEMPIVRENPREKLQQRNIKGSGWSKFTSKRQMEYQKGNELGPGQYDIPSPRSKSVSMAASPAFVSDSVRSFFDKIIFETNHDSKARQRQYLKYKSKVIGPGTYDIAPEKKKKPSKYQFFGSTEERKM